MIAAFHGIVASSAVASPGGSSPVSGMLLWLKADAISLADSDPVATWPDSSGNGNDATQEASGSRPTFKTGTLNGLPVVRFDGFNDSLPGALTAIGVGNYTVFLVAKSATASGYHTPLNVGGSLNDSALLLATDGGSNDGTWEIGDIGNNYISTTMPVITNAWHLLTVDRSGTTTAHAWVNGVPTTPASGNPSGQSITSGYIVGDYAGGGQAWNGDIAEILIYPNVLSDADRATIETYLAAKYAL